MFGYCYTVEITHTHTQDEGIWDLKSKLFAESLQRVRALSASECVAHCVFNPPPFREACGWFWKGMTGSKIGVP